MKTPDLSYKPHIDGLRAVAVIAVILFHIHPGVFSGGYLGVDVFFVISGFVITQSLYKDYLAKGKINIATFYIKRFKRLYPALLLMVTATTGAYAFFGFLWDTNLYLKSALTSIFATSNLYFLYHGDNYFHQDLINPLVHTWSLGIEEQFYFIYPLLLVLALWVIKKLRTNTMTLAAGFLAGSVGLYVLFYLNQDTFLGEFYFPLARFWELGAGCALFFFSQHFQFTSLTRITALLAAGSFFGIQFFQSTINDLHIETLVTVLATAAFMYAGIRGGGFLVNALRHTVATYIGRISYSLYLWHLPVIYFANLYLDGWSAYVVALVVSVACAMGSYHFVEKPLRYSNVLDGMIKWTIKIFPILAIGVTIIVLIFGLHSIRTAVNRSFNFAAEFVKPINYIESNFNLGARIQPNHTLAGKNVAACTDVEHLTNLTLNQMGVYDLCLKQNDNGTLFYLTGDSHAFHFLSALDNADYISNLYFTEIPRQSIVSEKPQDFSEKRSLDTLNRQVADLEKLNQVFSETYLVTSLFLSPWDSQLQTTEQRLQRYIETLSPHATLIFIAPTPLYPAGPESCVLLGKHCFIDRESDLVRRQMTYDMLLAFAAKYPSVYVYDAHDAICPDEQCVMYDPASDFLSYMDKDHLSVEQSTLLSEHFDTWLEETFGSQK